MQKKLSEKLKCYSALAAIGTLIGNNTHAQIVYTDINPDTTLINLQSYGLDLDNDGNYDYVFHVSDVNYSGSMSSLEIKRVAVTPYQTGFAVAASATNNYVYPIAFNANANINQLLNWNSATDQSMASVWFSNGSPGGYGNFLGVKNKFVAFKFLMNGFNHYGWARVDVAQLADTIVIKDFAFNQNADESILAGEGINMGIGTVQKIESAIIFNSNILKIICDSYNKQTVSLIIYNIYGKVVYSNTLRENETMLHLNNFNNGIYLVQLMTDDGMINSKKIVIVH